MAKKILKTNIIKQNLKTFNKQINAFNKRLKNAEKKGAINEKTYKMLLIDKDKKDFYRANIYTKKQFNSFVNNLKKANKQTLKKGRDVKILGSIVNDLAPTRYEKIILKQQLKKVNLLKQTFGQNYKDILLNVATLENKNNRQLSYEKLFNRYLKLDYDIPNKTQRFKDTLEKAYKERFGVKPDLKNISMQVLHKLSKLKKFDLRNLSDPLVDTSIVKEEFDEMIEDAKKGNFEDIEEGWEEVYE